MAALAVLAIAGLYVAYAGWRVSSALDTILRAGTPLAQGEGQPVARRPEDIGYVGDPGEAFGYPFETVAINTELGPAPAWVVQPETLSDSRWAIIVHGIGGRRENGYRFLPVLRSAGLPALVISYRNDVEAPPSPNGLYSLGLTEWRDLEAAVRLALGRGASGVVLVGESMGGAIIGQFLHRSDLASEVEALVLDAPMIDVGSTLSALLARLGVPLPEMSTWVGLRLRSLNYPIDLKEAVVIGELAGFAGPLFISHGVGDRIVSVASSDRLVEIRDGPTEYLRTDADHIESWKENPRRYDQVLAAFLRSLQPPGLE
ncbi:alpha/beta fold hydrolase [Mesorhizobium sp. VNQ89]|uniref:alpha/beta hydrolase family protein n=1 Tax=Mesorhizobium quangtriensis TaxID=3157709 RepID=UPI0032B7A856